MTIGGGVGSTAGGIKLLRLLIVIRMVQLFIQRTAMPSHAFTQPRLAGKPLEADDLQRATLIILLFTALVFVSWLVFVASGQPPINALFEVVSATGTVGLSTGITGPNLSSLLKVVLCVDMLAGRLEIVAFLILFYPRTWFGKRTEAL
jgi:trk system potassium uptake protein TrkH